MTDMYDGFADSDSVEDNDEDIGALGSILSWDEEDEAGVEASVAATSSALDSREKGDAFMHQFSGISDASDNFASMPMPNPVNFDQVQQKAPPETQVPVGKEGIQHPAQLQNVTQTQQQLQNQVQIPNQAQANPPVQVQAAPVVNPGVNASLQQQPPPQPLTMPNQQFPTPPMMFPMLQQQQSMFNPANANQQAMQFGMAQMMHQQQAQAVAQQQQQTQQSQFNTAQTQQGQQNQFSFNKVLLQQMQQAAAQQAAQQFNMQSRQMAAPPMIAAMPPQQVQSSMLMPQPAKKSSKRKSPPPSSNQAASKRRPPVVSSSDTDCDTSGKSAAVTKPSRGQAKIDGGALTDSSDTHHHHDTLNMTPAEKAKANRDRNREHARNTRMRKKAYLEKLKSTVDELCRERDTLVSERAGAATLLVEMHNIRTEVLMSFFALRSANEQRRELWGSILDESFACVMPVTPYRSFLASEVQISKCQRTVLGIDSMMADTASLHVLLNTLIDRSRFPTASIEFRYTLVTEDVVVAGNQMMARWAMSTVNAVQCGARMEVAKQGMLCAKFSSAHKIIGLELMFDVMAFMLQLKQATGCDTFSVIPNTVQTCQRSFDKPMVMTLAERPYTIVQVNKLWEDMTGYSAQEVVGKASCQTLQGEETDKNELETLMTAVRYKRPASALLVNYNKKGERFNNHLTLYPLSTDSKITHYVALTTYFEPTDGTTQHVPKAAQPLEGQAQLMTQLLPGPRPAPTLAPMGNAYMPGGAPTMPHPPLGFFPTQVAVPTSMPMAKMMSEPAKPDSSVPISKTNEAST